MTEVPAQIFKQSIDNSHIVQIDGTSEHYDRVESLQVAVADLGTVVCPRSSNKRAKGISMDVGILLSSIEGVLAPVLPYLLKVGEKASEEAGKRIAGDSWEKVKQLWSRLRPKVTSATKQVVNLTETVPPSLENILRQVETTLTQDKDFATELALLLRNLGFITDGPGNSIINVSGGVTRSVLIAGHSNSISQATEGNIS